MRGDADYLALMVSRKASLWHTVSAFMRVRSGLFWVPVRGSVAELKCPTVLFAPVKVEVVAPWNLDVAWIVPVCEIEWVLVC